MLEIASLEDIIALRESVDVECKLAQGRDGKGALPKDFWETYSAFANTQGGDILLGVAEKSGHRFELAGVADPQKVIDELWTGLNNPQKASANILQSQYVKTLQIDGKTLVQVHVPVATRKNKPVFIKGNPLVGTYRRLNSTDQLQSSEVVRRMLAEQAEDERDARILQGFGMEDIEPDSLRVYRQMLMDAKPGHPYLELDDKTFLQKLRGWRKDRSTGEEGLTLAGLLMFGCWPAIQEAAPHYFVDYQERPEAKTELRWVDRLVPDGSWSGNLFDFYRRVYRKLTEDLKVPFKLSEGQRREDTPVHEAIREALINTLVHADYSGNVPVLVVKRPDMFGFRNPGDMRIPQEDAVRGGLSDCRNRIMHQMFLMIGLGERAGSGLPKIYSGWDWRHWRRPALYQKLEPQQTLLELRMLELFPEGVLDQLSGIFGETFLRLSKFERLILATAVTEQVITHTRICEITTQHARDVTATLQQLAKQDFLTPTGHGRGTVYQLPGESLPTPEQVFGGVVASTLVEDHDSEYGTADCAQNSASPSFDASSVDNEASFVDNAASSLDNEASSVDNEASSVDSTESSVGNETNVDHEHYDEYGRLLTPDLPAPMIHDLEKLSPAFRNELEYMARFPRQKKRVAPEEFEKVLLDLCSGHYITRACLAELVKREPDTLRNQYLKKMLQNRLLIQAFPQVPTHMMQAYMTRASSRDL
ncbi:AAA family ATPase [Terasakiispira papahanaumokuakeensis]|uniref:AAA family ATPase n=1 Tax=Terasakiispira papahanaumokuakeensis TaxID=197479 RepID=A0A1E2V5P4_9GAMM|nr:RNA-binding domain-containing protein [Terasakiispira papahanaumokuakeensis]ODC02311.1 AAA family ATPase [Terasakiispira papahanaumokuakeensis]